MPPIKTVTVAPISRGGGRKAPSPALREHSEPVARPSTGHPTALQPAHRYHVGERLRMVNGGNRLSRAAAFCKVILLMPYEGHGSLLYRVRSESEQFERVVAEADLSRNALDP